jgi:hypothetical protein
LLSRVRRAPLGSHRAGRQPHFPWARSSFVAYWISRVNLDAVHTFTFVGCHGRFQNFLLAPAESRHIFSAPNGGLPALEFETIMPDNTGIKGPQDPNTVNVHQDHEVRYWCDKFGCTASELRAAVNAVGTNAAAVERRLRSKK